MKSPREQSRERRRLGPTTASQPGPEEPIDSAGHLFVIDGDLTKLTCDALLIPTDPDLVVESPWAEFLGVRPGASLAHHGFSDTSRIMRYEPRSRRLANRRRTGPQVWLGDFGRDDPKRNWYRDGILEFIHVAAEQVGTPAGLPPRLAVPVVGADRGGSSGDKGTLYRTIVGPLSERAGREPAVDVVLVCWGQKPYSAAQRERRRVRAAASETDQKLRPWEGTALNRVADAARGGRLVTFVGAGVSQGAGLPSWSELLAALGRASPSGRQSRAAADDDLRAEQFRKLDIRDQAAILARRLGDRTSYQRALVTALAEHQRYALGHGLLASLGARENITTNYDTLFEDAMRTAERECAVLPYASATGADRWLLKLHGSIEAPSDVVLTREDYLGLPETSAALFGILQAMLMTRHMLFVGYSLSDDSFHRVMHDVRRARREPDGGRTKPTKAKEEASKIGTVLLLFDDPLLRELWDEELDFIAVCPAPSRPPTDEHVQWAARRLDILLDDICHQAADVTSFLMDEDYDKMLDSDERRVRRHLTRALRVAAESDSPSLARINELFTDLRGDFR